MRPVGRYIWGIPERLYLESSGKIASLESQIAQIRAFDVSVTFGKHWIVRVNGAVWLLFSGVTLINRTERQVPVELTVFVATDASAGMLTGEACQPQLPAELIEFAKSDGEAAPFGRIFNLPGLTAQIGCCAVRFDYDLMARVGVGGIPELWKDRVIYLDVTNTVTRETKIVPLNVAAIPWLKRLEKDWATSRSGSGTNAKV